MSEPMVSIPLYNKPMSFIDTEAGWNLLRECFENGNMKKYRAAKRKFDQKQRERAGVYWPTWAEYTGKVVQL